MKAFVAVVLAVLVLSAPTDAAHPLQRNLILDGSILPVHTKTYMVGLRSESDSKNFCGGSIVSSTHVLTASQCAMLDIRWASIGSRYLNGTLDGEQIKIASVMNHPNFSVNIDYSDDFALLELETASSFAPVKLAAANDSDFKAGVTATALGWGLTSEDGEMSEYLRRVNLPLISDKKCKQVSMIDDTMVCAGGLISQDVCNGDSGGPLIVNNNGEDVLIGVVSWSSDDACGRGSDYPGVYSRVSSARSWIDPIISSSCFD